jgi:hypothetical protein
MKQIIINALAIFLTLTLACKEENPYRDEYTRTDAGSAKPAESAEGSSNTQTNAPSAEGSEEEAKEAAEEGAIEEEDVNAVDMVCQDPAALANFQVEYQVLCTDGQPTQAFADALANPYQGDNPQPKLLKSDDVNGISHFVLIAPLQVPQTIDALFDQRAQFHQNSFTVGNATFSQTELASTPAEGGNGLGSFDVQTNLDVSVGIINVNDVMVQKSVFTKIAADQSVIANTATLIENAPDNSDNIVNNIVSIWIADGQSTKIITVTHQQVNNRGQPDTAQTTFLDIGTQLMVDTYATFAQ